MTDAPSTVTPMPGIPAAQPPRPLIQQLANRIDDVRKALVPTYTGSDDEMAVISLKMFAEFVASAAEIMAKHVAARSDVA